MKTSSIALLLAVSSVLVACSNDPDPQGAAGASGASGEAGASGAAAGTSGGGSAGAAGGDAGSAGARAGGAGQAGAAGTGQGGAGPGGAAGTGQSGGAGTGQGGAGMAGAGPGGAAGTGQGGGGAGGQGALAVSPAAGTLLTCTKTAFTATGGEVTWSATAGTIDASGLYTSPNKVGPDATITATGKADATQTASVTEKLVTAVVGAKQLVASNFTSYPDLYPHAVASAGDRVYAATVVNDGGWKVQVGRSDDGGQTWGAPAIATPITSDAEVSCAAIAVDVASPDTVYVVFNVDAHSGYATTYVNKTIDDARTLVLVVSTDGGKTFPIVRLLQSGNSEDPIPVAQGICPDVASIAGNTVAVTTPGGSNVLDSDHEVGMYLWVDGNHGEGLTIKDADDFNSIANGETGALQGVGAMAAVGQNGGTNSVTESPRLFSDGKGTLCVTYMASTPGASSAWVQCSTDQGKTFSSPVPASPTYPSEGPQISHPTGSFGPKGEIVIAWHGFPGELVGGVNVVGVAVSTDGGKTFTNVSAPVYQEMGTSYESSVEDVRFDDAGVLWLTYGVYDGGQHDRLVVDKSCDLGATWSGAVVVNGNADGTIDNATRPSLVPTKGKIAVFAGASLGSGASDAEMRRYSLVP